MSLIRPAVSFVKTASSPLKLPASQGRWPSQILQEAYRQVPYLQDLSVELRLDRTNEVRGYGVGKLLLKEANLTPKPNKAGGPQVVIPVTIRDREMDPLDVLMVGGEIFPLTEEKLANQFSNLSVGARDQQFRNRPRKNQGGSLSKILDPPDSEGTPGGGMSSRAARDGGGQKLASEMLKIATATAKEVDLAGFKEVIRNLDVCGPSLQAAADEVMSVDPVTSASLVKTVSGLVDPDYLEVSVQGNGSYNIKTASASYFELQDTSVSRFEAEALLGTELLKKADSRPVRVVRTTGVVCTDVVEDEDWSYRGPGIYKVAMAGTNRDALVTDFYSFRRGRKTGEVGVLSEDGFTRFSDDSLAASWAGHAKTASASEDSGSGVFIWNEDGKPVVGPYCQVLAKVATPSGRAWEVTVADRQFTVRDSFLVKKASATDETILLPSPVFVPCPQSKASIRAAEQHTDLLKVASGTSEGRVRMYSGGGLFHFDGPAVGGVSGEALNRSDAHVVLSLLGHKNPEHALKKVARDGSGQFDTTGRIQTVMDVREDSLLGALEDHTAFPEDLRYRGEIVKLAAALPPDRESIDTVLALNFLNADNVRILRGYLPQLEKTASKLAEILMAARMGLNADPEPVRLAMHYVRRVADTLRTGVPEGA